MNLFCKCVTFISIFSLYCLSVYAKKPSYFPTCYRNDPNLNQCLINATEYLRPYLAKGIPELQIPRFEPFTIPELYLEQGTRALNFKALLSNVVIHGITSYRFSRFDFDVPNRQVFCHATLSRISLEGEYRISGNILIAPIEGNGHFTVEIASTDVTLHQKYEEQTLDDGQVYLIPILTNCSLTVQQPKVHFEGLFNGNKQLNVATNKVINDNIDELYEEFKPVVDSTLITIIEKTVIKTIVHHIPWDELYPVNPDFENN